MYPYHNSLSAEAEPEALSGAQLLAQRSAGMEQRSARKQLIARLRDAGSLLREAETTRDESRVHSISVPHSSASHRSRTGWLLATAAMGCGLLVGALAASAWNARKAAERSTRAETQTAALRLEIQKAARQIAGLESAQATLLAQLDRKSRDAFLLAQSGAES